MARVGALITPFVAQVTPSNHVLVLVQNRLRKSKDAWLSSSCRWCWSPLCIWLSPCTAAAAWSLPSPPVRCRLRRQAAACRSPPTGSGARRWWAGPPPPPTTQRETQTQTPAPRAEDVPAGAVTKWCPQRREEARGGEEAEPALTLWPYEPGSTIFFTCHCTYSLQPPLLSQSHHCMTAHRVTGKTKWPDLKCINKWWRQWEAIMK